MNTETSDGQEVKPCPFCGCEDIEPAHDPRKATVGGRHKTDPNRFACTRCGAIGPEPLKLLDLGTVGVWNKRDKNLTDASRLLKAAEKMLDAVKSNDPAEASAQRPTGEAIENLEEAIHSVESDP